MPVGIYYRTAEHNRRISESHLGAKNPMFGKHHSEEHKTRVAQVLRGRRRPPFSEEWKAKLGRPGKKRHSEEWKTALSKRLRGSNNPSWMGGRTPEEKRIRNGPEFAQWREAVYARDRWTCRKCGDGAGGNLNAHHVLNFSEHRALRFSTENGVTLCETCHNAFHRRYGTRDNGQEQLAEFMARH